MNISQVKKLRKIVRMKKLATHNSKIFVCTMNKTSVNYRMVLTLLHCFYPLRHFKIYNSDLCIALFQYFSKQFTDDYLSNHLDGQEARKVFIQHPRYNIEVLLKRTKVGRAIIHSHWPKVARTFNITEGSIFTMYDATFQRFLMLHVKLGAVV